MQLRTPALLVLLTAAFGVLIGLGVWQVQRNDWKQGLVEASHARTEATPIEVTDASEYAPEEIEYRRVNLHGAWQLDDVMFLANRARESVRGEEIIVPVVLEGGGPAVLVNVGWIPDGTREEILRELADDGRATGVTSGLAVDATGREGRVIPSGSWSRLDTEAMADALGYDVAPWFVLGGEERTSNPSPNERLPVGGWRRYANTTPHVEYALTWFGLAAVLAVSAVFRLVVAPRREAREAPPPRSDDATSS